MKTMRVDRKIVKEMKQIAGFSKLDINEMWTRFGDLIPFPPYRLDHYEWTQRSITFYDRAMSYGGTIIDNTIKFVGK